MIFLRRIAKLVAFSAAFIVVLPAVIISWIEKILSNSELVFVSFGQLLAVIPSPVGVYMRGAYYFGTLDACDWQTHIGFGCLIGHREAHIGCAVSMGAYCVIGHALIGKNVRMASHVSIPSGKRQHLDDQGRLSRATRFDPVSIGSGCWVGEGAIVMASVGESSIVSAGAVVVSVMPSASIIGGNPATVLKSLESDGVSDLKK